SVLDTGAKLEVIAIISGFATMYGAMQAAPVSKRNETPSPEEHTSAQIQSFIRPAASGDYPNLAAALATAGPQRTQDDVFESSIQRLIDGAGLPDKPSS
ncbi:MAG: TetR/AcrR family transcriptional regulator C-terminal domain-containing protein, partial [Streptosporangiaceae bacterium]